MMLWYPLSEHVGGPREGDFRSNYFISRPKRKFHFLEDSKQLELQPNNIVVPSRVETHLTS